MRAGTAKGAQGLCLHWALQRSVTPSPLVPSACLVARRASVPPPRGRFSVPSSFHPWALASGDARIERPPTAAESPQPKRNRQLKIAGPNDLKRIWTQVALSREVKVSLDADALAEFWDEGYQENLWESVRPITPRWGIVLMRRRYRPPRCAR